MTDLLAVSNWPFAIKMALGPTLAIAALIGLGLYGISATDKQAALTQQVVQRDLAGALRLANDAARLTDINGSLYRLTTLQASGAPDLGVGDQTSHLVQQTLAVAADLKAQAPDTPSPQSQAELLTLVQELRLYSEAIDVFGSMLEIDFPSAVAFFSPFDANAAKVLGRINAIAGLAVADARTRAAESAMLADRIRLIAAGTTILAALLVFGAVSLLTRATVRSVRSIAMATEKVAKGKGTVNVAALARRDELGKIVQSLAVFQANVAKIEFQAHHDSLTRLPNRILFHDRVHQALTQVERGSSFAVLCLDLDRFKAVNDTLGHPMGDLLLGHVATRLQSCVRDGDTVARLGGDEFAIILLHVAGPAEVDALCNRIVAVIEDLFEINAHQINIGTSIGIAFAPQDGSTAEELLKNADTALYGAKANGRGTFCYFEAAMNVALQSRRAVEVGLRQAIARDEFELHYQPLVAAQTYQVSSFEALIRWRHPERGLVPPDDFIPVAEASGLIGAIGSWVLHTACRTASTWPGDVKVAVNLSPSQFKDKNLVATVTNALEASGLDPSRLELEITESVLLHDSVAILAILNEIKALGVQISMDDFGTGYSSLSYLRSFPFDKVKIDRSFIKDLPNDTSSLAIVRAIVGLSRTFGMSVTAEGVETQEQARQLAQAGCTHLQGFLFSRPKPIDSIGLDVPYRLIPAPMLSLVR